MIGKGDRASVRPHPLYTQDRLLNGTLGFTNEDLAANRGGHITDRQQARLNRDCDKWKLLIGISVFTCLLGFVLFIQRNTVTSVFLWVVASITIVYMWLNIQKLQHDLRDKQTHVIEGQIKVGQIAFRAQGSPGYYLKIEGMSWRIRKSPFLAFADGELYAIYYAPHSKTILSAEWLRDTHFNA